MNNLPLEKPASNYRIHEGPTFVTLLYVVNIPLRAEWRNCVTLCFNSGAENQFLKAAVTLTDSLRSDLYRNLCTALRVRNYVRKSPGIY
jgi:hypothetical protein